jgi:hypothetical protein
MGLWAGTRIGVTLPLRIGRIVGAPIAIGQPSFFDQRHTRFDSAAAERRPLNRRREVLFGPGTSRQA